MGTTPACVPSHHNLIPLIWISVVNMTLRQAPRFTPVEQQIDDLAHQVLAKLPQSGFWGGMVEFLVFGLKQAWACLFGGAMIFLMLATNMFWPEQSILHRYDFLFLAAIGIQIGLIAFKLETWREARIILIFHLVGTIMELFKTQVGSWSYPEASIFHIGAVPLFSGFMYAAVGSYMARIYRIFDIHFDHYPPLWVTLVLASAIYLNFFTHHYLPDMRIGLFVLTGIIYARTMMHYRVHRHWHRMPQLIAFLLVTFFIWLGENAGTFTRTWLYPSQQDGWHPVSLGKFGSWFLLMIISVVLVTLIQRPRKMSQDVKKNSTKNTAVAD